VTYLYEIERLADWVTEPEFLAAFPQAGQIAANAGKAE
jgi:hypothetical protein